MGSFKTNYCIKATYRSSSGAVNALLLNANSSRKWALDVTGVYFDGHDLLNSFTPTGSLECVLPDNEDHVLEIYTSSGAELTKIPDYFLHHLFSNSTYLRRVEFPTWDFSNVTTVGTYFMSYLCYACSTLEFCTVPAFNLSACTSVGRYFFAYSFYNCSSLLEPVFPLHTFGALTQVPGYMYYFGFSGCSSLRGTVTIPEWDFSSCTSIGVEFFWGTFQNCRFSRCEFPMWNFSNITTIEAWFLERLFNNTSCQYLCDLVLPAWDFSNVTNTPSSFFRYIVGDSNSYSAAIITPVLSTYPSKSWYTFLTGSDNFSYNGVPWFGGSQVPTGIATTTYLSRWNYRKYYIVMKCYFGSTSSVTVQSANSSRTYGGLSKVNLIAFSGVSIDMSPTSAYTMTPTYAGYHSVIIRPSSDSEVEAITTISNYAFYYQTPNITLNGIDLHFWFPNATLGGSYYFANAFEGSYASSLYSVSLSMPYLYVPNGAAHFMEGFLYTTDSYTKAGLSQVHFPHIRFGGPTVGDSFMYRCCCGCYSLVRATFDGWSATSALTSIGSFFMASCFCKCYTTSASYSTYTHSLKYCRLPEEQIFASLTAVPERAFHSIFNAYYEGYNEWGSSSTRTEYGSLEQQPIPDYDFSSATTTGTYAFARMYVSQSHRMLDDRQYLLPFFNFSNVETVSNYFFWLTCICITDLYHVKCPPYDFSHVKVFGTNDATFSPAFTAKIIEFPDYDFSSATSFSNMSFFALTQAGANIPNQKIILPAWSAPNVTTPIASGTRYMENALGYNQRNAPTVVTASKSPAPTKSWYNGFGQTSASAYTSVTSPCGVLWNTSTEIATASHGAIARLTRANISEYYIEARFTGLTSGTSYTFIPKNDYRWMPTVIATYIDSTAVAWSATSALTFTATSDVHTLRIFTSSLSEVTSIPDYFCQYLFNSSAGSGTYVTFPAWNFSNVTSIGSSFLRYACSNSTIVSVTIPTWNFSSVTAIGSYFMDHAFSGSSSLPWKKIDSFTLNFTSCTVIGDYFMQHMFSSCSLSGNTAPPLIHVALPKCTTIGSHFMEYIFSSNSYLTQPVWPDVVFGSLLTTGDHFLSYIFYSCSNLVTAYYPLWDFSTLTHAGDYFIWDTTYNCASLSRVVFPLWDFSSMTSMGSYFLGANMWGSNNVSDSHIYTDPDIFKPSLPKWDFSSLTTIGSNFLYGMWYASKVRRVNLPFWNFSKVTSIGSGFLYDLCAQQTDSRSCVWITIPNWDFSNVTSIGNNYLYSVTTHSYSVTFWVPPKKYTGQPEYYKKTWWNAAGLKGSAASSVTGVTGTTSYLILPTNFPLYFTSAPSEGTEWYPLAGCGFIQNMRGGYWCPNHPHVYCKYYISNESQTHPLVGSSAPSSYDFGSLSNYCTNFDGNSTLVSSSNMTIPAYSTSAPWYYQGYHIYEKNFNYYSGTSFGSQAGYAHFNCEQSSTTTFSYGYHSEIYAFPSPEDDILGGEWIQPWNLSSDNGNRPEYPWTLTGSASLPDNFFNYFANGTRCNKFVMGPTIKNSHYITSIGNSVFCGLTRYIEGGSWSASNRPCSFVRFPGVNAPYTFDFSGVTTVGNQFCYMLFVNRLTSSAFSTNWSYGSPQPPAFIFSNKLTSVGTWFMGEIYKECYTYGDFVFPSTWDFSNVTTIGANFLGNILGKLTSSNYQYVRSITFPAWDFSKLVTIGSSFMTGAFSAVTTTLKSIIWPAWDFSNVASVGSSYMSGMLSSITTADNLHISTPAPTTYYKNQFNAAGSQSAAGGIATGNTVDIPWHTSSGMAAYERIVNRLVAGLPSPIITRRSYPTSTTSIPVTYFGVYLQSNKEMFDPYDDYKIVWTYPTASGTATSEDKYIRVAYSGTATLAVYHLVDGTWSPTGAEVTYDCDVPAAPSIVVTKTPDSPSGCDITISISDQNFIGTAKVLVTMDETLWSCKVKEFTAYHSGHYNVRLIDEHTWPLTDDIGETQTLEVKTIIVSNPDTSVTFLSDGHDVYLNATLIEGAQCTPYRFKLDDAHQYPIPYTKEYNQQPVTYFITEDHPDCYIVCTYRAGTAAALSTHGSAPSATILSAVKSVLYNGEQVADSTTAKSWLLTSRRFFDDDDVKIILDSSLITSGYQQYQYLFSGNTCVKYVRLPLTPVGTSTERMFDHTFDHTTMSFFEFPSYDTSAVTTSSYMFTYTFFYASIGSIWLPPMDLSSASDVSSMYWEFLYHADTIQLINFPILDLPSSGLNATDLYRASCEHCTSLKYVTYPPLNLLGATSISGTDTAFMRYSHAGNTSLKSITLPLMPVAPTATGNFFESTSFSGCTNLVDVNASTVDTTAVKSWSNWSSSSSKFTGFVSDVVVHHDNTWLTAERASNVTSSRTVTYEPPFPIEYFEFTFPAGTFVPVPNAELVTGKTFFSELSVNGTIVASTSADIVTYLTTSQVVSEGATYQLTIDLDAIKSATALNSCFKSLFSGSKIKTLRAPGFTLDAATSIDSFYEDVAYNCQNLLSISMGTIYASKALSSNAVYKNAFNSSTSALAVTVPSVSCPKSTSASEMFAYAFNNCTALTSVILSAPSLPLCTCFDSFYQAAFRSCSTIAGVTLPAFDCSQGTSFIKFFNYTFDGCAALTSLSIPLYFCYTTSSACYLYWSGQTFQSCSSLTSITMHTISSSYTETCANNGTLMQLRSAVTIHHDGDWMNSGNVSSITTFGGQPITFDPALV